MLSYSFYFFRFAKRALRFGILSCSGHNFSGRICIHHRGGGNKRNLCKLDYFRRINAIGVISKIIKSSQISSFIGVILYDNGLISYIILSEKVLIGDKIFSGTLPKLLPGVGSAIPLRFINLFSLVSVIELKPFGGCSLARSAGLSALLTARNEKFVGLKLKSGWNVLVSVYCLASLGLVSNSKHKFQKIKKAGMKRALGFRPVVRGVAMNPCDHPHGGGEGKKSPLAAQKSPWGWFTKINSNKDAKLDKIRRKVFKNF